jgi:integrase
MPRYTKKITRPMEYNTLKEGIKDLSEDRQALLTLLFVAGCRISEALALTSQDISCKNDLIYVQFFRLKGSKQTDPQEIPRIDALVWMCHQEGKLWRFSRRTAHRIVKRVFSDLYPHYFRMNRFTKAIEKFGPATVCNVYGVNLNSINHYIAKIDTKHVGKALLEELG